MWFSTRPTTPITFVLAFLRANVFIKPIPTPEPPISYFISSIPPAGLSETPPVSNDTPLPINAIGFFFLFLWPFHSIMANLDSCSLPRPTLSKDPMPNLVISFSPRIYCAPRAWRRKTAPKLWTIIVRRSSFSASSARMRAPGARSGCASWRAPHRQAR